MQPNDHMRCAKCRWYDPPGQIDFNGNGYCMLFPPMPVAYGSGIVWEHSRVQPEDYCGQFEAAQ